MEFKEVDIKADSDAPHVITSHSPKAPFTAIFEDDGENGYAYAATRDKDQEVDVQEVVHLYLRKKEVLLPFRVPSDVRVIWSEDGEKAALLIQNTFHVIFDFVAQSSYAKSLEISDDAEWKRLQLGWNADLMAPFNHILQPNPQQKLDDIVTEMATDANEENRLQLYKSLMKSSLFIPISAKEEDITHNYLIFPQENDTVVLCVFTDLDVLHQILGAEVHVKSIPCSSLFRLIQNRGISGVVITNKEHQNVIIEESEFSVLSFATNLNQLNYSETVRSLASILLKTPELDNDHPIIERILTLLDDYTDVKEAYLFQSSAEGSSVTIGLVLKEREERRLVAFYRDLRQLNAKYLPKDQGLDLSVLKDGEHLLMAVRESEKPLFKRT